MKRWLGLSSLFITLLGIHAAMAQEVRNYTGSARPGEEIRFDHWLNYDEATCLDRGFVRIVIRTQPKLGRVRLERTKVHADQGACTKPLSVVVVLYRAGRAPGTDSFEYAVQGHQAFIVKAVVTVN